jgi:hypothetical protein
MRILLSDRFPICESFDLKAFTTYLKCRCSFERVFEEAMLDRVSRIKCMKVFKLIGELEVFSKMILLLEISRKLSNETGIF